MLVFAIIAAVIALLLFCPVRIRVTVFDNRPQVTVSYLFFRFVLPPEKKRAKRKRTRARREKARKPKKAQEEASGGERQWTGESVAAAVTLIRDLLGLLGRSGASFLRGIRVHELKLEVMVVRKDPFRTAVDSGSLNAIVYGAAALLQHYTAIGFLYLNIYPGFWAARETVAFETLLSFRPGSLFFIFLAFVIGGVSPVRAFLAAQRKARQAGDA